MLWDIPIDHTNQLAGQGDRLRALNGNVPAIKKVYRFRFTSPRTPTGGIPIDPPDHIYILICTEYATFLYMDIVRIWGVPEELGDCCGAPGRWGDLVGRHCALGTDKPESLTCRGLPSAPGAVLIM